MSVVDTCVMGHTPRYEELAQVQKAIELPVAMGNVKDGYVEHDISSEAWREVVYTDGKVYRIDNPVKLVTRKGGSTHRVLDAEGVVHCYVAPESGKTTLRWKVRNGKSPVSF